MKYSNELEIQKIHQGNAFKVSKIKIKKGGTIKKHRTPTEAVLIVLEGAVSFHYEEEVFEMAATETIVIVPEKEHWVIAKEDSELVLVK